jgi:BirA family biotin operon repressor/biotin-[acetyl-CoA-carboxylase] ligase
MPFGDTVHRLKSAASTNDAARDLAMAGAAHGTAVVAEEQTRGRGTRGKAWHSPRGLGLYVSFILRGPEGGSVPSLHLLPLAAGLAASDAVLAAAGVAVRLKWPNDLVHGGKKLGGILSEGISGGTVGDFAVVGIGINVGHGPADFPAVLRATSTSLRLIGTLPVTIATVFDRLCRSMDCWYNALARGERGLIVGTFEDRMAFPSGGPIRVTTADGTFTGVCRGLDTDGRLVVERDGAAGTVTLDAVLGLDGIRQGGH